MIFYITYGRIACLMSRAWKTIALCVNPEDTYIRAKACDGNTYILAEALADTVLGVLEHEEGTPVYEVIEKFTGKDLEYKEYELMLKPGDKLFLYTDGVAEATRKDNTLFGTGRMIDALNINPDADPQELLTNVRNAVDEFVGGE